MPFRSFFGYWACVIIGRWIGGCLGYKPFFKEYTTDWDFAVAKMKGNFWTRRNVQESYVAKKPWGDQVALSQGPKATNAEYEALVTDMTEVFRLSKNGGGEDEYGQVNGGSNSSTNGNGHAARKRTA
jgi:hypothetical protein